MKKLRLALVVLLASWSFPALGAPPTVTFVQPAAAPPGREISLQLTGENLDGPARLWTSFPCGGVLERDAQSTGFKIKVPPQTSPGLGAIRIITTNGMSGLQLLLFDAVPSIASSPTNQSMASAQPLSRNTAVDGVCGELRSAFYRVTARKGERLVIEAVAQRIGSPLDPFLRVLNHEGHELAAVDDTAGIGADARIIFQAPGKGDYFIEIRDTRYGGGPRHRYRLRFAPPLPNPLPFHGHSELARFTALPSSLTALPEKEPNDAPSKAQPIRVPIELEGRFAKPGDRDLFEFHARQGERLLFTGRTRSLGSPCDLFFQIQTTNGTKVAEANVTGADEGILTNRFAEAGVYHLAVEELNRLGGPDLRYRMAIQPLEPGLRLSTETEKISVPAGDSFEIEVQAERRDYDGVINLSLVGLEEGFSVTNSIIPAKTNATRLKVTVPASLALGEFYEFGLVGSADVGGTDVAARVSTLPALRSLFPEMRYPPLELDGLLTLSISESKSASPPTRKKRRN